jgi:hypothetical protein
MDPLQTVLSLPLTLSLGTGTQPLSWCGSIWQRGALLLIFRVGLCKHAHVEKSAYH